MLSHCRVKITAFILLVLFVTVLYPRSVEPGEYTELSLEAYLTLALENDTMYDITLRIIERGSGDYDTSGDYFVDYLYENHSLFRRYYFDPVPSGMHYTTTNGGGFKSDGTRWVHLKFNYYTDIRYLVIKHNDTILRTIDLKDYFCDRNGFCEPPREGYLSCPEDCPVYAKDDYCSRISGDGKCDPDCGNKWDNDCPIDRTTNASIISYTMADFNYTEYEQRYLNKSGNGDEGGVLPPINPFYVVIAVLAIGLCYWLFRQFRKDEVKK